MKPRTEIHPGSRGDPGTWHLGALDGVQQVFLSCPGCGACGPLYSHKIDRHDGTVEPSVVCECGFHEFVVLVGWSGGG